MDIEIDMLINEIKKGMPSGTLSSASKESLIISNRLLNDLMDILKLLKNLSWCSISLGIM
jgi:hypothetical protein